MSQNLNCLIFMIQFTFLMFEGLRETLTHLETAIKTNEELNAVQFTSTAQKHLIKIINPFINYFIIINYDFLAWLDY